jgi:DNA polymerase epsilon subunit 2
MFEYYSADQDDAPMTFILIGSFISTPFPANGYSTTYKAHWDALADILSHFPRLTTNSSFVFIPGPNDPWSASSGCLPRRGIPEAFTNRVRRICKDVRFVSNPVRLGYFTQEICVFRSDIADALIRNRIMVKEASTRFQDPLLDEATLLARDVPAPRPLYTHTHTPRLKSRTDSYSSSKQFWTNRI